MSLASVVSSLVKSSPHLTRLVFNLFYTYATLGRRVKKTRRAFEKQLVTAGMSKEDAKRLSFCYEELRKNITGFLKEGVGRSITDRSD